MGLRQMIPKLHRMCAIILHVITPSTGLGWGNSTRIDGNTVISEYANHPPPLPPHRYHRGWS